MNIPNNRLHINDDEFDNPIYRIFEFDKFNDLINTKKLVLVNPSKWDDPFENFFLRTEVEGEIGQGREIISLELLANDWYGQCWTTERDSDALWRIYSYTKNGIRVKTTIRKLF